MSSHGFSKNQLCVWKYNAANAKLFKIKELTGHTNRVLHTAINPEGDTVVSAAADETLRFWKIFSSSDNMEKKMFHKNDPLATTQLNLR